MSSLVNVGELTGAWGRGYLQEQGGLKSSESPPQHGWQFMKAVLLEAPHIIQVGKAHPWQLGLLPSSCFLQLEPWGRTLVNPKFQA